MPLTPRLSRDLAKSFDTLRRVGLMVLGMSCHTIYAKAPAMDLGQAVEYAIQGNKVDLAIIDPKTDSVSFVRALAMRFATETIESRREQIVTLVRESASGRSTIRDRETLAGLLKGSANIRDRGMSDALYLLNGHGDPTVLATMPEAILRPLEASPFTEWLDLTTRAKPHGALNVLQGLAAKNPRLKDDGHWMQAMAANGDQAIEESYIKSFLNNDDPRKKMDLAEALRRIGTRKTLAALAQEMRTPMVYTLGRVLQVPLRQEIAMQLRVAFPELRPASTLNTDAYYAEIEAFCEKEFGTKWKTKRPPVEWSGPLEHGFQPLPEN